MTTRVLVDNCIFSDANMLQGAKLTTYKDREQTEVSSFIVGYIRKPPLPEKQARRQNEIDWCYPQGSSRVSHAGGDRET